MRVMNNEIYIITRTSERPIFFYFNQQSIEKQTYSLWHHVVSYDTANTLEYLKKYQNVLIYPVERQFRRNTAHFPYNLYCNTLQEKITDDENNYIMYLDDDDMFTRDDALEIISKKLTPDTLVIWKAQFPNKVVPSERNFGKRIAHGDTPSICFIYNCKF